ncbi:selenoprotein S B-like [Melitaea cinxia]|uniref:selenoprotein S B-like n=1 Tax=Melitaea cinxia TaxID=113334 RepID=UPI001E2735C1|nr:selenoprotein S B-like [Melitaea cinxia]
MDRIIEEEQGWTMVNPVTYVFQFFANYGWYMLGAAGVSIYLIQKLKPKYESWKQAREDAEYHKDPDKSLARMEAIQRARERQQQLLEAASRRALEQQKEREERKRQEALERLEKYGAKGGERLGSADDDYLPLSGGASTSSYKPPKRSACSRGGCGR